MLCVTLIIQGYTTNSGVIKRTILVGQVLGVYLDPVRGIVLQFGDSSNEPVSVTSKKVQIAKNLGQNIYYIYK